MADYSTITRSILYVLKEKKTTLALITLLGVIGGIFGFTFGANPEQVADTVLPIVNALITIVEATSEVPQ